MSKPSIFISYSHRDASWKNLVVKHLKVLEPEGVWEIWDDQRIAAGDEWYPEISWALESAAAAILLVSADFLISKFILGKEVPVLLKRRKAEGLRVIPVILRPVSWRRVSWLKGIQPYPTDGRPLSLGKEYEIEGHLTKLADVVDDLISRPTAAKKAIEAGAKIAVSRLPDKKALDRRVSPSRLPMVGDFLVSRQQELKLLYQAWEDPSLHIVSLVASGGTGKTALVKHWLERMAAENYRGAERVFDWSFYSQGNQHRATSADSFIYKALIFFGDPDPTLGGPHEKGERLARLVAQSRTLLILDGIEPLQHPPGPLVGYLQDTALATLIIRLAAHNTGLCVITTRLGLPEIAIMADTTAPKIDLEVLAPEAGAILLEELGVRGTNKELREASQALGGHALALTLLGTLSVEFQKGEVRGWWQTLPSAGEAGDGIHVGQLMQSFRKQLGGGLEWSILKLMGFFDRPASGTQIEALLARPPITGLTEPILEVEQDDRTKALARLRRLRLLADPQPNDPVELDTHPLIREYLAGHLQRTSHVAYKKGHKRLYEHLKESSPERPETLAEMMPLYLAMAHGCRAGLHKEVLDQVYWPRITRGAEAFSVKKLGAYSAELAVLSQFFEPPWSRPISTINDASRTFLLNQVGFHLRALGRLSEATEPMRAGLEADKLRQDWRNATRQARNLSELHLTLGQLKQAVAMARQSVELADRSGNAALRASERTTLADALHQSGRHSEAGTLFHQAEAIQKEHQPEHPLLYSLWGVRYCDFLLGSCEAAAWSARQSAAKEAGAMLLRCLQAQDRAEKALEIVLGGSQNLLDIAMTELALGRAMLLEIVIGQKIWSVAELDLAVNHFDTAVSRLREAGDQEFIARGLIARAQFHRVGERYWDARRDLDEAQEIASHGPMRLLQADILLEWARLHLWRGKPDRARQDLADAKSLVLETGYHRRDQELKILEYRLY